jgi:radical SAM protein with 4Fe4S-binding SPASM domain
MDPKRKFILFKQSKHFCSVPWNYFKVDMRGDVYTCVNGKQVLGNLNNTDIKEILLNPKLADIKQNLSNDILDTNCKFCQSYENNVDSTNSYDFLRGLYNSMFKSTTVDYDNKNEFKLQGVDLHWSSICDLKCITCWSDQSSSIAKEQGKEVLHTPTEQADKLIDYIVANQETLKEIYLSGGEPTLIKHNLRLLKKLRRDLPFQIRVNTNMMYEADNQIIKELQEFPNVFVTISADAMNERFNYIRRGADWNKFLKNLDNLAKTHFTWRVNSVFFIASALYLSDTQNFFHENYGFNDFTINQCQMGHYDLQCRNLPVNIKNKVLEKLTAHQNQYKQNFNLVGQLNNCIDEINKPGEPAYQNYFETVDTKAGTNWATTFPELVYAS